MTATKTNFLSEYKNRIVAMYPWAKDETKLVKFMDSVRFTLNGGNTWNRSGDAYEETLKALGLPKRVSLKALQSLPN